MLVNEIRAIERKTKAQQAKIEKRAVAFNKKLDKKLKALQYHFGDSPDTAFRKVIGKLRLFASIGEGLIFNPVIQVYEFKSDKAVSFNVAKKNKSNYGPERVREIIKRLEKAGFTAFPGGTTSCFAHNFTSIQYYVEIEY